MAVTFKSRGIFSIAYLNEVLGIMAFDIFLKNPITRDPGPFVSITDKFLPYRFDNCIHIHKFS